MGRREPVKPSDRRRAVKSSETTRVRARALRGDMTRPEVLLWTRLRRRQLGYQFRRQKPVGVYIVDFYCHELLLVVEVDGRCHDFSGAHDSKREAWLRSRGYTTLHLTGREVLSDLDGTVARVLLTCENLARRRDPLGK